MSLDLFGTRSKRIERRASAIYKEREGHCRVPRSHEENGFRLGRKNKDALFCRAATSIRKTWVCLERQPLIEGCA